MKKISSKAVAFFSILCMSFGAFAASKTIAHSEVASIDKHGNVNLAIKASSFQTKGFSVTDVVSVKVDSFKVTAPIVKDYSDVDNGAFLVRMNGEEVSLAMNMGNFAKTSGCKVGSKVTVELKEHYGYLSTFHLRLLKKDDERKHFASDQVFANFRAVKAGKIAENRLYRTSSPIVNEVRAPYAAELLEEAGVNLVLNLADSEESAKEMMESSPYYKKLAEENKVIFLNMGSDFSSHEDTTGLKNTLIFIAEHPGCVYAVHGKEGKNRTGYVCAILEALNGATLEEITQDYMTSFENYYNVQKNRAQYDEISKSVKYMFSNTTKNGKAPTNKNLQSAVENYLVKTVGLTEAQVQAVKDNLQK